ncbi:hypothetical protein DRQ09_08905 [candidate division KSB1 bacterium]|nr:MAG: hypothetical protein DRQ09_08905 [candidate division KSB1 bacterium]
MNEIEGNNISLTVNTNDNLELEIDPNQISQVFSNLIRNAIQSMPEGGNLTINCEKEGHSCNISFIDTGVGINEEDIDKLYIPFYTTRTQGIGLGLSISQKIIENHNGKIKIESVPGKGSTFKIELPF